MSKKLRKSLLQYMDKYPNKAPNNECRKVHAHIENLSRLFNNKMGDFFKDWISQRLCTPEERHTIFRAVINGSKVPIADTPKRMKALFSEVDKLMPL